MYQNLIVLPALKLGSIFWKRGDKQIIDGLGPDGMAAGVRDGANQIRKWQTGFVFDYAYTMLAGVVVFLTLFILFL